MRKLPPHKHTPSDIVEGPDDWLLPYLRSMRDPFKIERSIIEGPGPLLEGDAFPTEPEDRQLFRLTQDIAGYYKGVYRYDLATDTWVRLSTIHLWGSSFPTEGLIPGDTFYHTAQDKHYYWDGTQWVFDATKSHDRLTDVGADDHHAKFTTGDHAGVEHLASFLKKAIQPYNSNINFVPVAADPHDSIEWVAGTIKFADGGTQAINAGSFNNLAVGTHYIYFTVGSTSLSKTTVYSDVISDTRGLLCMVGVVSDTDEQVFIQPFYSKGLNIIADVIAVKVLSAICAHLGNVDIANGDVLLGDGGITVFDNNRLLFKLTGPTSIAALDSLVAAGQYADRFRIWIENNKDFVLRGGNDIYILAYDSNHNIVIGPGKVFVNYLDSDTVLRVPRYSSSRGGTILEGEIWLRTDL